MAAEERALETCPRKEGPENDSEETLRDDNDNDDTEKRLANSAEGRVCVDKPLCCDRGEQLQKTAAACWHATPACTC